MTRPSALLHTDVLAVLDSRLGMVEEGLRNLELKLNEASRERTGLPTHDDVALHPSVAGPVLHGSEARAGLHWWAGGVSETLLVVLEPESM